MRPLIYIMTPVLILTSLLASRFVTWDTLKSENNRALPYMRDGTEFLRAWKMSHAITAFTRAIAVDARYAEAYIKRGLAYYRSGQYKAAIADYNRTLALKRYHADVYASRADAYRALGDAQRAIADYTASIEKRWDARVIQRQAETYLELNNLQNALAAYDVIIRRKPNALAYYLRGTAYFRKFTRNEQEKNSLKLALADVNEAISREPRFAHAYIRRAAIYQQLGHNPSEVDDYVKAIELFTKMIPKWQTELQPHAQIYYWRALAYQKLGEIDKVRADIVAANSNIFNFLLNKIKNP